VNALVNMAAEVPENPLVPPIPELVIGLIAFFIVFGFLAKKILPNINKVLDERRASIEGRMEDAEAKENPLVPPIPELVIGLIAFVIVFGFLAKKLLPNINKVLDERREAIEGGIEKAEAAQTEAQSVLEQYKAQLAEARHEAARLRQEAQEQGATLIAEMRARPAAA